MIRLFKISDITEVMQIWLDANMQAHNFIPQKYWMDHYDLVKDLLPQAEVYVYENDTNGFIEGFVGLNENHIAGIFVRGAAQSKGIGKQLMDYIKTGKEKISLTVYLKNRRAIDFYLREHFRCQSESVDESTGEREALMIWNKRKVSENV